MAISCKILGHKWNGCKCERCGEMRDHIWDGCKCERCNMLRNKEHSFQPVPGKCLAKCSVCGREIPTHNWNKCTCRVCGEKCNDHDYQPVLGKCIKKCSVCGGVLNVTSLHDWNGCACRNCGEPNTDKYRGSQMYHNGPFVTSGQCKITCTACSVELYDHNYASNNKEPGRSIGYAEIKTCTKCGHSVPAGQYNREGGLQIGLVK